MIEWLAFAIVTVVIVWLVVGDFRNSRRRIPAQNYFHDRVTQADIDQWKARAETEEHERLLAHNLANQQEPIPWQKVPKNPPPTTGFPIKRKTKRVPLPTGSTPLKRNTRRTTRVNMEANDSNDAPSAVSMSSLFNGGDSTDPTDQPQSNEE